MITIRFATRLRGFFYHLLSSETINAHIVSESSNIYELNSKLTKFKNAIGRSPLFDWLGYIQIHKPKEVIDCDICGSFNRFLKVDKPYFIYVENPTALYHYRLNRNRSFLGRKRISQALNNPHLNALIFMSKAAETTFGTVCGIPHTHCIKEQIYPLVPSNPFVDIEKISNRCKEKELNLLYIAQGKRFISKGGLEVLEAFKTISKRNNHIHLHIITSINDLQKGIESKIASISNIRLSDFKYSFEELQKIYAQSHILIQPTSDESFGLTILEGMKAGLAVFASRLYAIPEMVTDGWNGYLCNPHYWFFDKENIPNPKVWNHRKKTIYSIKISSEIVTFLTDKIEFLYNNRNNLDRMSVNSYLRSNEAPFSESYISNQWNKLISKISKQS